MGGGSAILEDLMDVGVLLLELTFSSRSLPFSFALVGAGADIMADGGLRAEIVDGDGTNRLVGLTLGVRRPDPHRRWRDGDESALSPAAVE